jgi:NitT/TauT family transport system permease protein
MTAAPETLTEVPAGPDRAPAAGNRRERWLRLALPLGVAAVCLIGWRLGILYSRTVSPNTSVLPTPFEVLEAMVELARDGRLVKYTVSSLFRVTWAFLAAVLIGIPLGLLMGWFPWLAQALNPLIQFLRPISPIAWTPVGIVWFGLTEKLPVFLIFYSSLFAITVSSMAAVKNIQPVYVRAAQNFGLSRWQLFRRIILPATLPQLLTGLRIALGIAWLVLVAAEMVVPNPKAGGLGFLVIDALNQGSRYDLVGAGMVLIGLIGLGLDLLVRQLERFDEIRWGYSSR